MTSLEVTREAVVAEIKRLADKQGKAPGVEAFARESGISRHQWLGVYWSKWSDALADAGFAANELTPRLDSAVVLKALADMSLSLGRLPPNAEMKLLRRGHPNFPHYETFTRHFGGRSGIIDALRQLAEQDSTYSKLLSFLPPSVSAVAPVKKGVNGWVYLLKSGPHYKVGRSDTIERRVKEIAISLPEQVTLVHAIETDDPAGIEGYWHRRFSDRRQNGEWFKLTPDDLAAFKRRKFQ